MQPVVAPGAGKVVCDGLLTRRRPGRPFQRRCIESRTSNLPLFPRPAAVDLAVVPFSRIAPHPGLICEPGLPVPGNSN